MSDRDSCPVGEYAGTIGAGFPRSLAGLLRLSKARSQSLQFLRRVWVTIGNAGIRGGYTIERGQ